MKLSAVRKEYDVDTYRESLQIDKYRLDEMLMQQPIIQQTIAEMSAEIGSMRDAAKERVARVDAQAAKVLRNRLVVEEGKASEARIDREVPLTAEHKEAFYIYNELCALAAQWEALKDTARNRAFVLRDLVSLYTSNFFTDTSYRSESNPAAVKALEHKEAREALAQGRRARRTLSGIHHEVELLASVDDNNAADADLSEPVAAKTDQRLTRRQTTDKKAKNTGAHSVDNGAATSDTTQQQETVSKENKRTKLKDRLRHRSNKRLAEVMADGTSEDITEEVSSHEQDSNGPHGTANSDTGTRARRRRSTRTSTS